VCATADSTNQPVSLGRQGRGLRSATSVRSVTALVPRELDHPNVPTAALVRVASPAARSFEPSRMRKRRPVWCVDSHRSTGSRPGAPVLRPGRSATLSYCQRSRPAETSPWDTMFTGPAPRRFRAGWPLLMRDIPPISVLEHTLQYLLLPISRTDRKRSRSLSVENASDEVSASRKARYARVAGDR